MALKYREETRRKSHVPAAMKTPRKVIMRGIAIIATICAYVFLRNRRRRRNNRGQRSSKALKARGTSVAWPAWRNGVKMSALSA